MHLILWIILALISWPAALVYALVWLAFYAWSIFTGFGAVTTREAREAWTGAHVDNAGRYRS